MFDIKIAQNVSVNIEMKMKLHILQVHHTLICDVSYIQGIYAVEK